MILCFGRIVKLSYREGKVVALERGRLRQFETFTLLSKRRSPVPERVAEFSGGVGPRSEPTGATGADTKTLVDDPGTPIGGNFTG